MTRELESRKDLVDEEVTRHDNTRHCEVASHFPHWVLHSSTRHCEEGKRSVARRGNLLNRLLRHFVPRNDGNSGNPQSLIKVTDLTSYRLNVLTTSRKVAFTMAEVLITLGVIGIVAAMTIPNLVQSYKKKVVETKLVKFYSMMNNAIKLAEVDYGPQSTWTDYHIDDESDEGGYVYDKGDKYDFLVKKYFAPYIKITSSEDFYDVPVNDIPQKIYYLSDGSAFSFGLHENRELFFYPSDPKKCLQTVNQYGKCRFVFTFIPYAPYYQGKDDFKYNVGNGVQPDLQAWDGIEEHLKTSSSYGCNNNNGSLGLRTYCTEVVRRNGWKIPEDYPFKF